MRARLFVSAAFVLLTGCGGPRRLGDGTVELRRPPQASPRLPAPDAGPTIRLHHGRTDGPGNAIADFMYFVPLISPERVTVATSVGNTQRARVVTSERRVDATSFSVVCRFEVTGAGSQHNSFDHTAVIRRHKQQLQAGKSLDRRLDYIRFEGPGRGRIEVDGTVVSGIPTVTTVRLVFNDGGRSPVTIGLKDIRYVDGACQLTDELVARVNTLTFRDGPDPPRMGVTVASVRKGDAADNLWESVKGRMAGAVANLLIKPIRVEAAGNRAMLDFGLALLLEDPAYTFPRAKNLRGPDRPHAGGAG